MDINLINLLVSIMSLVISIGGVYVIKFLNNKIGNENLKHYYELAKTVVMFIEQSNPQLAGVDKKDLAINKLIQLSHNKLSHHDAETLIEAAVYDIKNLIKDNVK